MKSIIILLSIPLFFLCGCRKSSTTAPSQEQKNTPLASFPLPQVPEIIVSPDERDTYLLLHYWNCFDFKDTTLLHKAEICEQGVVDYLALVGSFPDSVVIQESIQTFCSQFTSHSESQKVIPSLIEKYLYNPNSPLRNDPLWILFLDNMLHQDSIQNLGGASKWRFLKKMMLQNLPGSKANDFTYYNTQGKKNSLYRTSGEYTVLFFYDPACPNCHQVMLEMRSHAAFTKEIENGRITVLAICDNEDEEAWRNSVNTQPEIWKCVTDRGVIEEKALYDLKASPTLYLLDRTKKVLLKDCTFKEMYTYLGLIG